MSVHRPLRLPRAALLLGALALVSCFPSKAVTTESGLRYVRLASSRGTGLPARVGQRVSIHETVSLAQGPKLYSTHARGTPVEFVIGGGGAIAGVDEGVRGMRVGDKRLLIVPPSLSRRSSYPPNVPRDSVLFIEVEVVRIRPR